MKRLKIVKVLDKINKEIKVSGFVRIIRSHGNVIFIDLEDISGRLQLVFTPDNKTPYDLVKKLGGGSIIEVIGKIGKRPKGTENPNIITGKIEMLVKDLKILSKATQPLPIPMIEKGGTKTELQKRLNWRWIDLRKPEKQLIFKVWTIMEQAFREYCIKNGFIQIHSPKLMSSPSESGAELFEVKYFNRKAYLAQSPQFYKQMAMAAGFEKVFETGPVFRANPSFTPRHDTEFTSYDIEMSYINSHYDVMKFEEKLIIAMLTTIRKKYGEELKKLYKKELTIPKIPFPKITMKKAKKILNKIGIKGEKEHDLSPEEERKLSEMIYKKYNHEFVFVTDYNIEVRPFYHMRHEDNSKLTKSFDLLWNGTEITTGAQREHRYNVLISQAKEKGLNLKSIQYYLNFFKYGCPPHGGFALGPTRILTRIFDIDNVREVTFLYRGPKRLTP